MEKDPASTAAEYLATFRTGINTFVSRESVWPSIDWGIDERECLNGNRYAAFVDPSGGSADAMTLAIAAPSLLLMHGV
jgi:hypothetical protein